MKKRIPLNTTILYILFSLKSYSQNTNHIITSSNDTIYVNEFNISNRNIKVKINNKKRKYSYNDLIAIYDFKKKVYYEKITPENVEYKDSYGDTFFAERITNGKILIYKYLTNKSHSNLLSPNAEKKIIYRAGSNSEGTSTSISNPGGPPTDKFGSGTFTGRTYSSGSSRSFFSYYIGIKGFKQELLCYNEILLTKDEFKILNSYLQSNNTIRLALENLFFSDEEEKENSVIELVNKYNQRVEQKN